MNGSVRRRGSESCSAGENANLTAIGWIVAACDAPYHRPVRLSRNSTVIDPIVLSSCRRARGDAFDAWYSIANPFSGVLSSPSTNRRIRVLGDAEGVSAVVLIVSSSPVDAAAVTPVIALGFIP